MKSRTHLFSLIAGLSLTATGLCFGTGPVTTPADENIINEERNKSSYDQTVSDIYTGRSPYVRKEARTPEPAPAPKPAPAPAPARAPAAPQPQPARPGCSEVNTGLMHMTKTMPAEASVGSEFMYEIKPTALNCVANVVVTDIVPEGATYVRSEPAAQVQGNQLVWTFPNMEPGEAKPIKVWLRPEKEGTLASCATVKADPRVCASTVVGKPALAIQKTGPATAMVGSDITYNIVVSNPGSSVAKDVVVVDTIPQGLTHSSGKQELSINVGDLQPKQSRPIPVTVKAAQRGKFCNVAVANSSNAGKVNAEACTTVVQAGLKVAKTGDAEALINKTATYNIVVSNTGDVNLDDVVVTDVAPEPTKLAAAEGASIRGNNAVWRIPQLKPGENKSFKVTLGNAVAGKYCNSVTAATQSGLRESAQACTTWKGIPAVLIELVDDPDPIQIGETTTYTIRVTNQGTADLNNVGIVASYPKEIKPESSPQGTVEGQNVKFPAVARLASKQFFTYTIKAKGAAEGDARTKVSMTATELATPVVEEESTRVY